ncbi:hypothetical protein K432DRAFT_333135 [Lepidopterella palustris CBS 459.81]|uniref:Uncharacterized protein n=1 Tax=Lepidopterella palustris CBS 459.81 TaxID=1314670 RepID=A0A8E2E5P3_9PEZI|nr:hypothetical protein K432DRAFT_333135 [Lepidopterella palustris CBS 459.81]
MNMAIFNSGLPSPTLTNPDMILPESTRSFSPSPYDHAQRPPSPSSLLYFASHSAQTIKLASAPQGRRGPSPRTMSPPITARSSVSTLPNIAEVDATPTMRNHHDDVFASSPTLRDSILGHNMDSWEGYANRRLSNASSSVHSEDLENMKWPGFDGPGAFDDSGVVLDEDEDEEEHIGQLPKVANGDDDLDNERWLDGPAEDGDDDPYSSAALSRRAEIILANAKKRLNVMEGNLRGARHSLLITPSSSFNTLKMASELSQQLSAARDRDRQLYGGLGFIPPRQRPFHSSPLSSSGSPGHSRVLSETSVPSPLSPGLINRANGKDRRSSSAMAAASGPWSPLDGHAPVRSSIRETKSQEVMREHRGSGWPIGDRDYPLHKLSGDSRTSPTSLEPLPEDEAPKLHRSASTTSDLRVQMNELKGKISTLKKRAREDGLRRRSLQNLRTPSPFTAAEIWYSGAEAYKTNPISADAGIGVKADVSPTRQDAYKDEDTSESTPKAVPSDAQIEDSKRDGPENQSEYQESHYEDAEETSGEDDLLAEDRDELDEDVLDDTEFVAVEDDDVDFEGDSIYEDAAYDAPVAARHEDRLDAFDYEHFFLHSAMGSYSSASRRSSASSGDSVETTRPITSIQESSDLESTPRQSRLSVRLHQRNDSADSVSTMATFATANEGHGSDDGSDEEANERLDEFSQQILAHQQFAPMQNNGVHTLSNSTRPDSVINLSDTRTTNHTRNSAENTSQNSGASSPGADLVGGLRASQIFSILLDSASNSDRRLSLNEQEKQLIYGLAASFQQVCMNLQSTAGDQYERKEWRRRLDEARKVLDGELEGEAF